MEPQSLSGAADRVILEEAVQRGLLDPWRVDDILEQDVVPSLQRIEQLLEGQQGIDGPAPNVVSLLEEIADNTGDVVRPEVRENLPLGAEGNTTERIAEGETGEASFSLEGTIFNAEVTARAVVRPFQSVRVVGPENAVIPFSAEEDVLRSDEAAGVTRMAIVAGDFTQTATGENNITIAAGETEVVLESKLEEAALWWATGTNDKTFSRYQYQVDEEDILASPQLEPLGLYNDPFRFPQPLVARDSIRTVVTRDADASAPADYFSKHRFIPIADYTADRLERSWEVT